MTFCHICFISFSFNYYFFTILKIRWRHWDTAPLYLLWMTVFSIATVPWSHPWNQSTIQQYIVRIHSFQVHQWWVIRAVYFSFPIQALTEDHIAFISYIPLISFNLEAFSCFTLFRFALVLVFRDTDVFEESRPFVSCNIPLSDCFLILDSLIPFEV